VKLRIVHVITGLPRGGAEMMLYKLLSRIDRSRFESAVISLREEGPMAERIRTLGANVESLGMRGALGDLGGIVRLRRSLVRYAPHVVQTWLYHADLLGGLAAKLAGSPPIVWGLRMGVLDPREVRRSSIRLARLCARLSRRLPSRIVCCSQSGRRWHTELGYDAERMTLIPNGFDIDEFHPDESARRAVHTELGIADATALVGLVARFDPHKDHQNFVAAAAEVTKTFPDVRFVLLGAGTDSTNAALTRLIDTAAMHDRFVRLGARSDVSRLTAAFDVAVSSSLGEGFSNAIGEAMACGVPCVVTDVGDSAWIVGDTGRVVPPRDPTALAGAIGEVLRLNEESRRQVGLDARQRILDNFELSNVVRRYEELYLELTDHVLP
jgi:glycosyltransferase involved in cell wall biosynthesis